MFYHKEYLVQTKIFKLMYFATFVRKLFSAGVAGKLLFSVHSFRVAFKRVLIPQHFMTKITLEGEAGGECARDGRAGCNDYSVLEEGGPRPAVAAGVVAGVGAPGVPTPKHGLTYTTLPANIGHPCTYI